MGPPTSINNSLPPLFQLLLQGLLSLHSHLQVLVWTPKLTAAASRGQPSLWDWRERDCVPLRGWSGGSAVFVGSSFLSGHSRSQILLLLQTWTACGLSVSQWPQAFAPSKSLLGTVHVTGGGYVSGSCACRFLPSRLGDLVVAEKDEDKETGDRGQKELGTEGLICHVINSHTGS